MEINIRDARKEDIIGAYPGTGSFRKRARGGYY